MKPFILLQLRPEDEASDNEYHAFLRFGDLSEHELARMRIEHTGVPSDFTVDDYAGILVGGGPYNVSDPDVKKTNEQRVVEGSFKRLLDTVLASDTPFFGACYGIGITTAHCGGIVSKKHAEAVSAVDITLTEAGMTDPLLSDIPSSFRAFVGHKEACEQLPENAVLLASSSTCFAQMLRFGENVYATQFHPELDADGIATRIRVYKNHGYFPADEAEKLIERTKDEDISNAHTILRNFVRRYRTPSKANDSAGKDTRQVR